MDPATLSLLISIAKAGIEAIPAIQKEFEAVKAAASATPDQLAALQAQIDDMHAARMTSWAAADAALDAAAKT